MDSSDSPLADRIVLVAGATRGAGRGIAVAFGAAGATVYGTPDADGSRPDAWGYIVDVRERGLDRSVADDRERPELSG